MWEDRVCNRFFVWLEASVVFWVLVWCVDILKCLKWRVPMSFECVEVCWDLPVRCQSIMNCSSQPSQDGTYFPPNKLGLQHTWSKGMQWLTFRLLLHVYSVRLKNMEYWYIAPGHNCGKLVITFNISIIIRVILVDYWCIMRWYWLVAPSSEYLV